MTDDPRLARETIGRQEPDDYIIRPTEHAALYQSGAPHLAEVLRSAPSATAAEEYEHYNNEAIRAQAEFKRAAGGANITILLTATLGAAVMLVALIEIAVSDVLVLALGVTGLIVGAMGAYYNYQLKQRALLRGWMKARAKAETQRAEYFTVVTNDEPAAGSNAGIPLGLLQLEYFRRYELDVQVTYYTTRQDDHRRAADRTAILGGVAVFLAALVTGLGGFLGGLVDPTWAGLAALGILAAALAAFASNRDAISQDSRNAERYERTREALQGLAARLDEVRAAVAEGNHVALREYVAAVHDHMSVEHRQWLSAAESTRAALGRLDAVLSRDPPAGEG